MAETLGQTIRGLRQKNNTSQQDFAEQVGLTATSLSQIERGKTYPSQKTLDKIAEQLNIPVVVLNLLSLDLSSLPHDKRKALETPYKELRLLVNGIYDLI